MNKNTNEKEYILVGLSASKKMTDLIANHLGVKPCNIDILHFSDGEILVRSAQPLRNKHVIVVQSTSKPVNENVMELLIAIDSFKRASAKSINVIIPYYGYARQDRKSLGREPITAKLIAKLIQETGASHVTIVEIHSEQQQGFFDVPVDTLSSMFTIMKEIKKVVNLENAVIVSPDYGSVKRSRNISHKYDLPLVILDKRRPRPNMAEISNVLGEVNGKDCIIFDDIIDTGGTIIAACKILKEKGARDITIAACHGILSADAEDKINKAIDAGVIKNVFVSNSIESVYDSKVKNLKIVDLSHYLAEVIKIYIGESQNNSVSQICQKEFK